MRAFGASGRRGDDARPAIQRAIDACAAAGGGTVLIPPGEYTSGSLELRSHVRVCICAGATVYSAKGRAAFPSEALFHGQDLVNVTLEGRGTIDGCAEYEWRDHDIEDMYIRPNQLLMQAAGKRLWRSFPTQGSVGHLVRLVRCTDVLVRDLSFVRSPSWNLHLWGCERVVIEGVDIRQPRQDDTRGEQAAIRVTALIPSSHDVNDALPWCCAGRTHVLCPCCLHVDCARLPDEARRDQHRPESGTNAPKVVIPFVAGLLLYIMANAGASWTFRDTWFVGAGPGGQPPWYFIGQDWVEALWAASCALALTFLCVAGARRLGPEVWVALTIFSFSFVPAIGKGVNIALHTSSIGDREHAQSEWLTFAKYMESRGTAFTISLIVAGAIAACTLALWVRAARAAARARGMAQKP